RRPRPRRPRPRRPPRPRRRPRPRPPDPPDPSSTATRRRRRPSTRAWSWRPCPCRRTPRTRAATRSGARGETWTCQRASARFVLSWRVRPLHQLLAQHRELPGELPSEVLLGEPAPPVGDAAPLRRVDHLEPLAPRLVEVLLEVLIARGLEARDQIRVRL